MKRWASVLALAVVGLFLGGLCQRASAADEPAKTEKPGDHKVGHKDHKDEKATKDKASKAKWAVIKVGEQVSIVQEDKVKEIEKDLKKEYTEAKKKSKKAELKTITTLKGGFATEKDAQKWKDDQDKKKSEKTEKAAAKSAGGKKTK